MLKRLLFLSLFLLLVFSWCHARVTVSGYVRDAASGELLIGANVSTENGSRGTTTNEYGFYALSLEPGAYTFVFSYLGYSSVSVPLNIDKNRVVNMELEESLLPAGGCHHFNPVQQREHYQAGDRDHPVAHSIHPEDSGIDG